MTDLPSHGTGYAESEAFMDVVVLFNTFTTDDQVPDFTTVRQRLHDSFNMSELRDLEIVAHTMINLINAELMARGDFSGPQH